MKWGRKNINIYAKNKTKSIFIRRSFFIIIYIYWQICFTQSMNKSIKKSLTHARESMCVRAEKNCVYFSAWQRTRNCPSFLLQVNGPAVAIFRYIYAAKDCRVKKSEGTTLDGRNGKPSLSKDGQQTRRGVPRDCVIILSGEKAFFLPSLFPALAPPGGYTTSILTYSQWKCCFFRVDVRYDRVERKATAWEINEQDYETLTQEMFALNWESDPAMNFPHKLVLAKHFLPLLRKADVKCSKRPRIYCHKTG